MMLVRTKSIGPGWNDDMALGGEVDDGTMFPAEQS